MRHRVVGELADRDLGDPELPDSTMIYVYPLPGQPRGGRQPLVGPKIEARASDDTLQAVDARADAEGRTCAAMVRQLLEGTLQA